MMKRILLMVDILFVEVVNIAVHAQSNATDGALDGYVQDERGAMIANARIVARILQTTSKHTLPAMRNAVSSSR